MPTSFNLLMPKIRSMGDQNCHIHLDAMREIYMVMVLNLTKANDKCSPPLLTLMKLCLGRRHGSFEE